ncbi:iron-sulfur cluster assembly scaffold protein [Candidatus Peregrinibacteria bacterium]|nr:iron-sulfur cluster assembly scaffold protein [Candidatus Peregrinibacteria bacterium]
MDIYAQNILDRYKNPLHKDKKLDATASRKEANHSCGDSIEINLKIEGDKAIGYSFAGAGCAISMASADMLGDLIHDMTTDEILALKKEDIYEMLGIEISLRRSKCALLSLITIQNALIEKQEKLKSWTDYI